MKLTVNDVKLLQLLQQDCSASTQQLAERLNISQSPCWRRIHRLQETGVIAKQVALLDRDALGMDIVAFTTVSLDMPNKEHLEAFEHYVKQLPEVMECYTMTGMWDYMLKIVTKDIRHFESFVREKLTTQQWLREVQSHLAITEIKNTTSLPLGSQL